MPLSLGLLADVFCFSERRHIEIPYKEGMIVNYLCLATIYACSMLLYEMVQISNYLSLIFVHNLCLCCEEFVINKYNSKKSILSLNQSHSLLHMNSTRYVGFRELLFVNTNLTEIGNQHPVFWCPLLQNQSYFDNKILQLTIFVLNVDRSV